MPDHDSPPLELKITAPMIEAGADALTEWNPEYETPREAIKRAYVASVRASPRTIE